MLITYRLLNACSNCRAFTRMTIRTFSFHHHQRQSVDETDDIGPFSADTTISRDAKLVGEYESIIINIIPVNH